MNCTNVRDLLPELLYGDLPNDQAAPLREHLTNCSACASEFAALTRVRRGLEALPPTLPVAVDLARLYQEAARRQERRLRLWRRTAVGVLALAAVLLIVFTLRLEIRSEGHQLVVRWGEPPPEPTPTLVQSPPAVNAAEVELLRDLVHALEADVRGRDARQQQAVAQLRARLDTLQGESDQRWADNQQTQRAFYTALFGPNNTKGQKP